MHNAQWGLRMGGFGQTTGTTQKQLAQRLGRVDQFMHNAQ